MRKILVLRGGALGDFIVTLPALALLRASWPSARIELSGNATAAALARNRGLLDAVHSQHEPRWASLFGPPPLPEPLAAWLREFDLVLNFWPDPDAELARHFPMRDGQLFLSAPALPSLAPAAAHYCEPLRQIGLVPDRLWHELKPLDGPAAESSHPIAIHPGSGSPRKNWPAERWHKLIHRVDAPVLLVLGDAEAATWDAAATPQVRLARNLPLEELVRTLAACRAFVGHDSGVSHLAAACGLRCVLLFGPTDPAMWAPPTPQVRTIRHGDDPAAIAVPEVLAALTD